MVYREPSSHIWLRAQRGPQRVEKASGWSAGRKNRTTPAPMAIRVTLDRVLLDRRMSLTELGDRVGITLANLSILKTGKAKAIRFSTLEALCRELNCQPGDILIWDPDEAAASDEDDGQAVAAE